MKPRRAALIHEHQHILLSFAFGMRIPPTTLNVAAEFLPQSIQAAVALAQRMIERIGRSANSLAEMVTGDSEVREVALQMVEPSAGVTVVRRRPKSFTFPLVVRHRMNQHKPSDGRLP